DKSEDKILSLFDSVKLPSFGLHILELSASTQIGLLLMKKNDHEKAIKYFEKKLEEISVEHFEYPTVLTYLGNAKFFLGHIKEAKHLHERALSIALNAQLSLKYIDIIIDILTAMVHIELTKKDKQDETNLTECYLGAIGLMQAYSSNEIYEITNLVIGRIYQLLSDVYIHQNSFAQAESYSKKAIGSFSMNNFLNNRSKTFLCQTYLQLASIHYELKKFSNMYDMCLESLKAFTEQTKQLQLGIRTYNGKESSFEVGIYSKLGDACQCVNVVACRSNSNIVIPPAKTGRLKTSKKLVTTIAQVKRFICSKLIKKLTLLLKQVVIKLIPPKIEETPAICKLKIAISTELPK
ncbi:unnamed protein product, partial [Didymodactylos carnosus]